MKTYTEEQILQEVTNRAIIGIGKVMSNELEHYSSPLLTPSAFQAIIDDMGGKQVDMDKNGWDADYWIYVNCKGKQYTITGSGYYGKTSIALTPIENIHR